MKTGLLAMATLPLPEPATVMLPTLIQLIQFQLPFPKRLRQLQSSSWLWSRHDQTPVLMKTGLLAMATSVARAGAGDGQITDTDGARPDPDAGRLWLRFCQNQLSCRWFASARRRCRSGCARTSHHTVAAGPDQLSPAVAKPVHSPLLMKTGLLAMATCRCPCSCERGTRTRDRPGCRRGRTIQLVAAARLGRQRPDAIIGVDGAGGHASIAGSSGGGAARCRRWSRDSGWRRG